MEYTVYILKCSDDTLYTGITTNLERRMQEHNGIKPGGAKYTQARQPVKVVFSKTFPNRSEATKEELRIKKLSRQQKINLIQNSN